MVQIISKWEYSGTELMSTQTSLDNLTKVFSSSPASRSRLKARLKAKAPQTTHHMQAVLAYQRTGARTGTRTNLFIVLKKLKNKLTEKPISSRPLVFHINKKKKKKI